MLLLLLQEGQQILFRRACPPSDAKRVLEVDGEGQGRVQRRRRQPRRDQEDAGILRREGSQGEKTCWVMHEYAHGESALLRGAQVTIYTSSKALMEDPFLLLKLSGRQLEFSSDRFSVLV